jgi:hypothetical protein
MKKFNVNLTAHRLRTGREDPKDILLVLRGKYQRKHSWDTTSRMALLDTVVKGWTIGPVYTIHHIADLEEHIFDGAHRLETLCNFVNNEFPIEKRDSDTINWKTSALKPFVGMYYRDLPYEAKQKIRDFEFDVNTISREIAEDPNELMTLWIRLNNSGNKLNDYEMYIPIYSKLYEFLEEESKQWKDTFIAKKKENERGAMSVQLMRLLALSERTPPPKYTVTLDKAWRINTFGKTSDIDINFTQKKDELSNTLKNLRRVYKFLKDNGIDYTVSNIIYVAIIGRMAYWFDSQTSLTRNKDSILEYVNYMLKTPTQEHHSRYNNAKNSDQKYKNAILLDIDSCFMSISTSTDEARCFTAAQQIVKLAEQKYICPECCKPINRGELSEGHHVDPYATGGKTIMSNLQVLHKDCHTKLHSVKA